MNGAIYKFATLSSNHQIDNVDSNNCKLVPAQNQCVEITCKQTLNILNNYMESNFTCKTINMQLLSKTKCHNMTHNRLNTTSTLKVRSHKSD
jgi:hypothetical protein